MVVIFLLPPTVASRSERIIMIFGKILEGSLRRVVVNCFGSRREYRAFRSNPAFASVLPAFYALPIRL